IDECALRTHTCWNDSACINLAGGFDCLCPSGPSCSGDCPHEGGLKHNGQHIYALSTVLCPCCPKAHSFSSEDAVEVLQASEDGKIFCRRTACDCQNPNVDLFCCPECDTRVTSQCLDQSGHKLYRSGDNWTHSCQQCRCLVRQFPGDPGTIALEKRIINACALGLEFQDISYIMQSIVELCLTRGTMYSAWTYLHCIKNAAKKNDSEEQLACVGAAQAVVLTPLLTVL
ncbi:hypothetical protein STEG23_020153, partial [Scotinomys teguina]